MSREYKHIDFNYLQANTPHTNQVISNNTILFYDGLCGLCDSSVQFVLRTDKKKRIKFCALQSKIAKNMLKDNWRADTFVLLHKNKVYYRSNAALKTFSVLGMPYQLAGVFFIIPRAIRDFVYNLIALNRYKWFGKLAVCKIPDLASKNQFIVDEEA